MQRYVAADVTLRSWQRNVRHIKTQRQVSGCLTLRIIIRKVEPRNLLEGRAMCQQ